jgi:uncharacterized protein (TIGR03437 family)
MLCIRNLALPRTAPLWPALVILPVILRGQCVNFPVNFIPLSTVNYVTAANSAGDHLVVGALAGGVGSLSVLPLPAVTNQVFCGSQVQLAPQQFYSNVYVPTAAEQSGNFSAFSGLLVDPSTNQPFSGGIIPVSRLGAVYAFRIGAAQTSQTTPWSPTGSMAYGRDGQAAVLLPSGKVLVVGGCFNCTAELYDPTTGTFASAGTPVVSLGVNPTATLLQDRRVLIAGGDNLPSAAEIYDPVAGQFSALPAMLQPHGNYHTATLLNDGRVLIVGGSTGSQSATSGAELFNPVTGTFTAAGAMSQNRFQHTATLLSDGRVLVVGGITVVNALSSAEIFDPSGGTFSTTAGSMVEGRQSAYAILLPGGKVLVSGGDSGPLPPSAVLFDPANGTFTPTDTPVAGSRYFAGASLLPNGQVLVSAGYLPVPPEAVPTASSELYIPASGTFASAGNMTEPRVYQTSTLLLDGRVLVTGGQAGATVYSSAELYTPVLQGLVTSQTGVTFRAAPNSASATQTIQVLSPSTGIPWTLSVRTFAGGNWLSATPSGATDTPTSAPTPVSITVNPSGLAAQDYYGAVTLTPTDGVHPPISITVVLSIVPAGTAAPAQVSPTGLVFVTTSGVTAKPQTFTISSITSNPLTFTATAVAAPTWFAVSSKSGSITTAQPVTITVTPTLSLATGVYPGTVTLAFSDSTTQTVTLLLVVSSSTPTSSATPSAQLRDFATAACTPTKLLPVLTSVGAGFSAPAGWPVAVIAQIVDDCGDLINTGSAVASFTNSDPPVSLIAIGGGAWSATWVPGPTYAGSSIRVDAQTPNPALVGSVQVSVAVASNPTVPVVTAGGIVSSGDYSSAPALGLLVSIFGSGLADATGQNSSLPLPTELSTTSVVLSGGAQLPLLYVSSGQINVLIPYEAAANATHQLVVQRNNAISVPVSTSVFSAAPAILSTAGNGLGQGHIYVIEPSGAETLADQHSPAAAGNTVVIYCVGLGAVNPPVTSGGAAPGPPLAYANAAVTVTFGGQAATPGFAGLTPGFAGLYQVNVVVPTGVTPGNQVPVTVSAGGKSSSGAIFMAVK